MRLSGAAKSPRYVLECGSSGEGNYYEQCREQAERYLKEEPSIHTRRWAAKQKLRRLYVLITTYIW